MKKLSIVLILSFLIGGFLGFGQNPADCVDAVQLCGSIPVGIDPNGVGFDEFSEPGNRLPPCYDFANNNVWFKVEIDLPGTFGFEIIPSNGTDDYDFAVYGPVTDCSNLGNSIRCSSTNPQDAKISANTGLNSTETDVTEGPGPDGNGYLKELTVQTGETYYILVDRARGSVAFNINLTGSATLPKPPSFNPPIDLKICDDDGTADRSHDYDLGPSRAQILSGHPNTQVSFHSSLNDANLNLNPLPDRGRNTSPTQTIYARIKSKNTACFDIASFEVQVSPLPEYNIKPVYYLYNLPSPQDFDLDVILIEILQQQGLLLISFHESQADADANRNAVRKVVTTETPRTVYLRVVDPKFKICTSVTPFEVVIKQGPKLKKPLLLRVCREFRDELTIDLRGKETEALDGLPSSDYTTYFYATKGDQQRDENRLLKNYVTSATSKPIYMAVYDNQTGCVSYTEFALIVQESPDFELPQDLLYCLNAIEPLELLVPDEFAFYSWSTGEEGPDLNKIGVTQGGEYSVTVTARNGCTTTRSTFVNVSNEATITGIDVTRFNQPNNGVEIQVTGEGDYELALDNGGFQDSNRFDGILRGYHTITIRDKIGCGSVISERFLILDYGRYFTPNGDGYHDTWDIVGLEEFPGSYIRIFDRYGKLLKELGADTPGWDGMWEGALLPFGDYWFSIAIPDGTQVKGHFSLVR